ncbi:hypothetical protein [Paraburkholderia sp. J63]|uniref:hypothetical protein n=1 Tax=Paraburkholderia sp. J63 TaxID=2805434 RepID=UPI002ABE83CD|nr:hypothetical protein [Paraburkholderia sp. J63]
MAFDRLQNASFTRDQIAVALTHSSLGGGHLGVAFHSAKDGVQLTHLAWHQQLKVDNVPSEITQCWICTTVELPPLASKAAVAVMRSVSKKKPLINYGIGAVAAKGSFTGNGVYRAPKGSDGLTCATFVVEILRNAGIPLVKYETWKDNPENVAWGEAVCNALKKDGVPDEHVDAVRKNVGKLRLRPYEAVGAAMLPAKQRPADYEAAQPGATAAEAALVEQCPRNPRPPLLVTMH